MHSMTWCGSYVQCCKIFNDCMPASCSRSNRDACRDLYEVVASVQASCIKRRPRPVSTIFIALQVISSEVQSGAARSSAPTSMELMALRTRTSSAQEQYPLPRTMEDLMTFSVMPHDHRNYALTWFSLAGATALLALRAGRLKQ